MRVLVSTHVGRRIGYAWPVRLTALRTPIASHRRPRGGEPRMQKLRPPPPPHPVTHLVGAQGYQRFPLSKPVIGQTIALHAVCAYRASTYLVSAFPAHSISCSPNFSNPRAFRRDVTLRGSLGVKHQVYIYWYLSACQGLGSLNLSLSASLVSVWPVVVNLV